MTESPQEIAPGIYRVDAIGVRNQISVLLVREGDGWMLVDTGTSGSPARIRRALSSLGAGPESLRRVVITHHHIDHIGGVPGIRRMSPAAELCAPGHEAEIISGERPPDEPSAEILRRPFRLQRLPTSPVDRIVQEGETVGGLRAIPTPGHTLGHISLISDEHGLLFTADAFARLPRLKVGGIKSVCADPVMARRSAERLLDEEFASVLLTHGGMLRGGDPSGDPKARLRSVVERCDYV